MITQLTGLFCESLEQAPAELMMILRRMRKLGGRSRMVLDMQLERVGWEVNQV
jgi:hypothetical protein